MQRETEAHYPAPSDVVISMFADADYHRKKLEKLGIEFEILEQDFDGDELHLKSKRLVPVQASGIAAKFMPETTEVVNDERWRISDKSGAVVVDTRGVPLAMSCTAGMRDNGDHCIIDYHWDITANIPVGGSKLEKFVVGDMEQRESQEKEAALALLDGYR